MIDTPMTEHQLSYFEGLSQGLGAVGHKAAASAIFFLVVEVRRMREQASQPTTPRPIPQNPNRPLEGT